MRRTVLALALLATLPACSLFRKAKLTDSTPAHTPAQNSTPFGEWVLFTDPNHRWGAIGRNGQPLVNPVHASRKAVTDDIERLLADTRPML